MSLPVNSVMMVIKSRPTDVSVVKMRHAWAACGDGIVQPIQGEQCDDGNTVTETCAYGEQTHRLQPGVPRANADWHPLGDGVVQETEACDDSNNDDGDYRPVIVRPLRRCVVMGWSKATKLAMTERFRDGDYCASNCQLSQRTNTF